MYRWPRGGGPPVYVPVASGGDNGIYTYVLVASGSRRWGGFGSLRQLLSNRMRNRRQQHLCSCVFRLKVLHRDSQGFSVCSQAFFARALLRLRLLRLPLLRLLPWTCLLLRLLLLWLRGTGGHGSGLWNSTPRSTRKEPCAARKCGAVNSMSGAR